MEVDTKFNVDDTVFFITQLVDTCNECDHFLHTTHPAIIEGTVTAVIFTKTKNRTPMCDHGEERPDIIDQIEYTVQPEGEGMKSIVYIEDFFVATREEAQETLDNLS